MKKYLAVLLGVFLILSLAATAFAEDKPEITLGGKMILRGWYFHDVNSASQGLPAEPTSGSKSEALYTSNIYLTVDAKVTDNVRAFIELESASNTGSGTAKDSDGEAIGTVSGFPNTNSGVYYWGTYDSKPNADILIRQAWIQYTGSGLLGVPAGIKAGHVLVSLGEKIFFDATRFGVDGIMIWTDPTKELHLAAATAKLVDSPVSLGSINHTNDLDAYMVMLTYMLDKDNTLGANYTLVHSDANLPSLGSSPNCDSLNFQNAGLHANGKIAGLSYAAEADFQFGKVKAPVVDEEVLEDTKFSGWGVLAKLGYMIDPVNIRAMFAMGSGDKDAEDDKIQEFQALVGTDSTGAIARFTHYTLVYERMIRTAAAEQYVTTNSGGNIRTTGIANTTIYSLGLDVNPVKELSLSLDGFILRATKTELWDDASKDVGWEIDFKGSYKIAKNLSYFVEAGLFKPGSFYEDVDWGTEDEELFIDKKTVTTVIHGLKLEF